MSYTRVNWKDHIVQYPNRVEEVDMGNGYYNLVPSQGTVTQQGTPMSADNLNVMDKGIKDAHDFMDSFLNKVYPVGSIYISAVSTNPGTVFGGTWTQIQDRFLLAASSTYAAGSTGGEASHTLTTSEIPSHVHSGATGYGTTNFMRIVHGAGSDALENHTVGYQSGAYHDTSGRGSVSGMDHYHEFTTNATGGGEAHNNMPPYLAVFVWQRTA